MKRRLSPVSVGVRLDKSRPRPRPALKLSALVAMVSIGTLGCSSEPESPASTGDAGIDAQQPQTYLVRASDFDRSCQTHSDCILVFEGDYCDCWRCSNATISAAARSDFQQEAEKSREVCGEIDYTRCSSLEKRTRRQATSCPEPIPICLSGECVVVEDASPHDLPKYCEEDSQCALIPNQFCESCACQIGVNQEGYQMALAAREVLGCAPDPEESCACDDIGPARCINNVCYPNDGGSGCDRISWDPSACQ